MTNTQETTSVQTKPINPIAPAVAGLAAIAMAIYQVTTPGAPGGGEIDGASDWLREVLMLTYLVGSIAACALVELTGMISRPPAWMIQAGYALIAVGVAAGMVLRDDPDWFFLLGGPGLLLSTIGFIYFGVSAFRRRTLPLWAAVLAGVGGAVAIIMAEFGTSVLIGAFWLYVASRSRAA